MNITLPPLDQAAFLLDLDGTLLDIAPTPDTVVVAPGLLDDLARLRDRCGGALAIVTGRTLREVDSLLGGTPYAVAAEHGTSLRHGPGQPPEHATLADPPPEWLEQAAAITSANPGVILEHKRHGFVLHYRNAPHAAETTQQALRALLHGHEEEFVLLSAKMAWEIRPAGTDKGSAVRAIMQHPPFAGRSPIFVGDDVTDEDGIAAAVALGGFGLRVADAFGEPRDVRRWIAQIARS